MDKTLRFTLNLSSVSFLNVLGFGLIAPILPAYALTFNIPIAFTGVVVSIFAVGRLMMDIPAGVLADRLGRKQTMIPGLVILSLGSGLTGFANDIVTLLLARLLAGAGAAFYMTAAFVWLAEVGGSERRGRLMGILSTFTFSGFAVGPVFGGFIAAAYGLSAPFYSYAVITILAIIPTMLLSPPPRMPTAPKPMGQGFKEIASLFRRRSFILVATGALVLTLLRGGVQQTLLPLYFGLNLGLNEAEIGIILGAIALTRPIIPAPAGLLSDRIGRKPLMMAALIGGGLTAAMYPHLTAITALIGVGVIYGLFTAAAPMSAYMADVVPGKKLGPAMGVFRVTQDIGLIAGPVISSVVAQISSSNTITPDPFNVISLMAVISGLALIRAPDPARRSRKYDAADTANDD
jgi:MFS family permease